MAKYPKRKSITTIHGVYRFTPVERKWFNNLNEQAQHGYLAYGLNAHTIANVQQNNRPRSWENLTPAERTRWVTAAAAPVPTAPVLVAPLQMALGPVTSVSVPPVPATNDQQEENDVGGADGGPSQGNPGSADAGEPGNRPEHATVDTTPRPAIPNVSTYEFWPGERKQWNRLNGYEKLPYLHWARAYKESHESEEDPIQGHMIVKEWNKLSRPEILRYINENSISLLGRYDEETPQQVDVSLTHFSDENSYRPEGSEEDEIRNPLLNQAEVNPRGLAQWRFIRALYRRNNANEEFATSNTLWAGVDTNQVVRDRVVAKNQTWESSGKRHYLEGIQWNERVFTLLTCRFIAPLRGWAQFHNTQDNLYRLTTYMDFYPAGSLESIINLYDGKEDHIPEPFIWAVFLNVAQALYKLEKGRIYPDPRAKDRWRRIAHRDIKPENIFLGEPARPWNSYPYPLLADFDHAGMMSQADVRQPGGQKGTQGYSAPENMWRWDEDGEPKPDISPKSDIFVLGIVIWDLVHSSLGRAELRGIKINPVNTATMWSKDGTFLKEPSMEGKLPIKSYTARLTSLMWECLQINPDNRPDAKQLIERANAAIGDLEEKVTGPFLGKEPIAAHLQLMSRSREDRYPMGVRYNFKKRRAAGGNGGDDDDDDDGNDKDKDKGNDEEEEENEEGDNNNEEEEEQRRRKRPKTGGGKAGKPGPVPEGYREDNDR